MGHLAANSGFSLAGEKFELSQVNNLHSVTHPYLNKC